MCWKGVGETLKDKYRGGEPVETLVNTACLQVV